MLEWLRNEILQPLTTFLFPSVVQPYAALTLETVIKIIVILVPLLLTVAILPYFERKIIGFMQDRIGPNRVGILGFRLWGFGQPFADAIKLFIKEIITPSGASKVLFFTAPILSVAPSLAAWAVIPFDDVMVLSDINAGLLYILALTSLSIYGIIIAGWASNSKYAFLGAMRSAAQIVAYEIAMGFALVGVLIAAGSLNLGTIVTSQSGSFLHWFWLPLLPLMGVYFISGIAETNRAPFDVAEGESEIVAGFHVEYSGIAFSLFFMAEYANMILVSVLAATLFFGGWLSPLQGILPHQIFSLPFLGNILDGGLHWLLIKTSVFLFLIIWFRATFPRYRYDQIMRLGWKVFIPITIVWLVVAAVLVVLKVPPWFD